MNCRECHREIPAYLSGDIDEMQLVKLEEHFACCELCSQTLVEEQALDRFLKDHDYKFPEIDVSSYVMQSIDKVTGIDKVTEVKAGRAKPFSLIQDLLAAAAAAIILFSGVTTAADNLEPPNYNSAINSFSGKIGMVTSAYFKASSDAVDDIFITLDALTKLTEGDEKK